MIMETHENPFFQKIGKKDATNLYRNAFIKSELCTIRKLFGDIVAGKHNNNETMVHSVFFNNRDLRGDIGKGFLGKSFNDFNINIPKVNPTMVDGYCIHTGIKKGKDGPIVACLLTFGIEIRELLSDNSSKDGLLNYYIDGNLDLGIYKIQKINFDFEFILSMKNHLSCSPHCEGDKLKPK